METQQIDIDKLTIDISNTIISDDNEIVIETTTEETTPVNISDNKSILIDREKYDKECSKWSSICFILGVFIVMVVGVAII
tara:strand:- start:786 stop:1028 length:243 start_codon:yes stop_codon:yes gene_type:complete